MANNYSQHSPQDVPTNLSLEQMQDRIPTISITAYGDSLSALTEILSRRYPHSPMHPYNDITELFTNIMVDAEIQIDIATTVSRSPMVLRRATSHMLRSIFTRMFTQIFYAFRDKMTAYQAERIASELMNLFNTVHKKYDTRPDNPDVSQPFAES